MNGAQRWWRPGAHALLATAAVLLPLLAGAAPDASAAVAAAPAAAPASAPIVMILLDTNGSVAGAGMAAERRTAQAYARALPAWVRAGLITFNTGWRMAVPPTTDRARLAAAIAASRATGPTSDGLYGALAGARVELKRLGTPARSRLLVLTDAEVLTGPALTAPVPTDVVTWYYESDDHLAAVRALAPVTRGHLAAPGWITSLAALLPAAAPAPTARPSAPATPATTVAGGAGWHWQGSLFVVLVAVFLALFVLALMLTGSLGRGNRGRRLAGQIERYGPRHAPASAEGEGTVARTAIGLTAQLLQSANTGQGLAARLDLAGMTRSPAEWVLLGSCFGFVLAAALALVTGSIVFGVAGGLLLGWLCMRLALTFRIGRRRAAFSEQLPDVLQLIAGSLQSGFSLPQALDAVVREDAQPAAGEFARALAEARLGADLEDALEGVANRMDSSDMRWTVMAVRIQRGVGGNLAEVLHNIVGTMRERAYLRRQVRALSAEGRLSAYILVALPILVGGWLFINSSSYMRPLYTTPVGVLMLAGACVLVVVGAFWMRAMIRVEV